MKKILVRISIIIFLVISGVSGFFILKIREEFEKLESEDPSVWEPDIRKLEKKITLTAGEKDLILFTGSSSIRFWFSLEEDMRPINAVKTGFGGSKIRDVMYYADRIIFPFKPTSVVLFAGTNDISGRGNDKTPDQLAHDFYRFAKRFEAGLPDSKLYFISITPTPGRWDVWPEVSCANQMIQSTCDTLEYAVYLDLTDHFLNDDGIPDPSLFWWDGVHMNRKGYSIWKKEISAALRDNVEKLGFHE
jgi:hypothetical protein